MSLGKQNFFDRDAVLRALDNATRRALSKIGAFVRTRARSSMGQRTKKIAKYGQAPRVHEGSLKNKLFFAYDGRAKSVVVGPIRYRRGNVPRLLEEGGTGIVVRDGKQMSAQFAAHPYMGPALAKERQNGKLADAWKDVMG